MRSNRVQCDECQSWSDGLDKTPEEFCTDGRGQLFCSDSCRRQYIKDNIVPGQLWAHFGHGASGLVKHVCRDTETVLLDYRSLRTGKRLYEVPVTFDELVRGYSRGSLQTTARFWVWWNDGWAKLTLQPGKEVVLHACWQHEEGWSSETEVYRHAGDAIVRCCIRDGRDCDGRLTRENVSVCRLSHLKDVDQMARAITHNASHWGRQITSALDSDNPEHCRGIFTPSWQQVSSGQYDEYAEAAGY